MICSCDQSTREVRIDPVDGKPHSKQCFLDVYQTDGAQRWDAAAPLPEDAGREFVNKTDIPPNYPQGKSRKNGGATKTAITEVLLFHSFASCALRSAQAEPDVVRERVQVLHAGNGDIVTLVSDDNCLEDQGAVYKDKFWSYPQAGILMPHPNGGYIFEIHINDDEAFMDQLCRNDHFAKKSSDRARKQALKDCLERALGFR